MHCSCKVRDKIISCCNHAEGCSCSLPPFIVFYFIHLSLLFFLENFFLQAPVKVRGESLQTTIRKNKKSKLAIARFLDFFLSQLLLEMEYIKYHIR